MVESGKPEEKPAKDLKKDEKINLSPTMTQEELYSKAK